MRVRQTEIQALVSRSSIIFSGTVVARAASSVANLAPQDNFVLARIDRSLRSDPALGDLRGKLVTVALLDPSELKQGSRAIFFALDWIHGGGIAVREVAHVDVSNEDEVAAEVALLPERHLIERLADAVLILSAEVASIERTPFDIRWRNAPQWAFAALRPIKVLRGQATQSVTLLIPTSRRPIWARAPRVTVGQAGIFVLRRRADWTVTPDLREKFASAFTALDPADVQPESSLGLIEKLVGRGVSQ